MTALVRWTVFCAGDRPQVLAAPGDRRILRDRRPRATSRTPEKLAAYRRLADEYFETERYLDFCASRLRAPRRGGAGVGGQRRLRRPAAWRRCEGDLPGRTSTTSSSRTSAASSGCGCATRRWRQFRTEAIPNWVVAARGGAVGWPDAHDLRPARQLRPGDRRRLRRRAAGRRGGGRRPARRAGRRRPRARAGARHRADRPAARGDRRARRRDRAVAGDDRPPARQARRRRPHRGARRHGHRRPCRSATGSSTSPSTRS